MDDQGLSIFEDETAVPTEQEPEPQEAAPEPDQEAAPEADQPEASDKGETEAAPPAADPEGEKPTVPIQAILDERDKRQKLEREAEAAKSEAARYQQQIRDMQAKQEQQPAPDWFEDPTRAAQHQMQMVQAQMQAQTLKQSRFFAERDHGPELVGEAYAFFDQNPQLSAQLMDSPSPFHAAVEFYQKQKFLNEVGSNPDAWREKERARIREELATEMQTAQPKPTPTPPKSLSAAPAGGKLDAIAVEAPAQLNALFNG